MTHSQIIDPPERWNEALVRSLGNYAALGSRPWSEVRELEFLPGIPIGSEVYILPEQWLPPGTMSRLSARSVRPVISASAEPAALARLDESLRRSLVGLALPRQTQTGVRRYKPSSWKTAADLVIRMANWSAANRPSPDGNLWSHLTAADWAELIVGITPNRSMHRHIRTNARWLAELGARGILTDFPRVPLAEKSADDGPIPEEPHRGKTERVPSPKLEDKSYQPFSDTFVTAFLGRALWFYDSLAPQLIDCWRDLLAIQARAVAKGRRESHPSTTAERRAAIAAFPWQGADGKPLDRLPWPVSLRERGQSVETLQWPPTDAVGINMMVSLVQALNFCVVNFCTGARTSELLGARDGDLDFDEQGRLRGKTFKVVDTTSGQPRDWPLHPAAQKALVLQFEIAKSIRPTSSDDLWVTFKASTTPAGSSLSNVTEQIVLAVDKLGLNDLTGDSRPHAHRWRHTVARIVALTLVTGPQVLMDLFGHRDLEMTMRYMLSSPQIAEEVMKVAEEAAHAIAEEAILEVDEGIAGGRAASAVERGLINFKMARGEERLEAENLRDAIDILTFNGRYWQLVREGVLCTKSLGEYGPCTKDRGTPDPGSCHTSCEHRLETIRAKQQCEGALCALLTEHAAAAAAGQMMIVANLEGQILANLRRWDDVRARMLSISEISRTIWNSRSGQVEGGAAA